MNDIDLLDYFAAKAMQAIISKSKFMNNLRNSDMEEIYLPVARGAYCYARAMVLARKEYDEQL